MLLGASLHCSLECLPDKDDTYITCIIPGFFIYLTVCFELVSAIFGMQMKDKDKWRMASSYMSFNENGCRDVAKYVKETLQKPVCVFHRSIVACNAVFCVQYV